MDETAIVYNSDNKISSNASDSAGEESTKSEPISLPADKRICLVGAIAEDDTLCKVAHTFDYSVLTSETGTEYLEDDSCLTIFVLELFEGPIFDAILKTKHRILGPTALQQLSEKKLPIPTKARPLYSLTMTGVVVCFTGFRKKEELTKLIMLIHNMGGSIRKDMGSNITHLIANAAGGEKYQYALTFRVHVMSQSWVHKCWEERKSTTISAVAEECVIAHKLKPFFGTRICFLGFSPEEQQHMSEVLIENGGDVATLEDVQCTHVVMPNGEVYNTSQSPLLNASSQYSKSCAFTSTEFHEPLLPNPGTYSTSPIVDQSAVDNDTSFMSNTTSIGFDKPMEIREEQCKRLKRRTEDYSPGNSVTIDCNSTSFLNILRNSPVTTDEPPAAKRRKSTCKTELIKNAEVKYNLPSPYRKRARDSMDNVSQLSVQTDMMSPPKFSSAKKFKLNRRPSLKRSMSFVTLKTPLSNLLSGKFRKTLNSPSFKNARKALDVAHNDTIFETSSGIFDVSPLKKKSDWYKLKGRYKNKRPSQSSCSTPISDEIVIKVTDPGIPQVEQGFVVIENSVAVKPDKSNLQLLETPPQNRLICVTPDKIDSPMSSVPTFSKNLSTTINAFKTSTPHAELFQLAADVKRILTCSVVDESNTSTLPEPTQTKAHIVKAEWFWKSIQNEGAADEQEYLFEEYLESLLSPSRRDSHATPGGSTNRLRKRKRLHETINSLVHNETNAIHKRRSSISDAGLLSVSGSFLDCTGSPEKQNEVTEVTDATRKNLSPRQQVFLELVQTESNYVNILHTIMNMFKSPLEEMLETDDTEALLNNQELKIIFGNLPPIYEIHRQMLEELRWSSSHWTEDTSIGNIFLKFSPDLVKAYPPFVNFFETMKDMLVQCDVGKPRFHAFLKICQTKPECGRQSLQELMIRPVQRLPSISLLLNDILKHTSKSNPDHSALVRALEGIKEVMTHINEDKRKTDAQLVMFDIFNDIDNCPPHLVSSHRGFICRAEVMELSEGLSGRGDTLILFLFTDVLEVCKKRSKVFNSLKSPNTVNSLHSNRKPYKHIKLLHLSTVKKVIEIRETEECHNVFAVMCRNNEELKEKIYSFTITDETVQKVTFLRTLCRQMANTVCKADAERLLIPLEAHQLEISTSDVALGTLSKAFKFATRTRMKVGRAFSFNKTPSKLKRAMSTMMSPFGSTTSLTPASQLAQMRLASCNNISELGNTAGSGSPNDVLVAPMSVQPTRKAKCSSLSVAALRRL